MRSSRQRARKAKRIEAYNGIKKTVPALNYIDDGIIRYDRAIGNSKIVSSERIRVLAVQVRVVGYPKERSRKLWHGAFLKPRESAEWIRLGTYAPIVTTTDRPIPLDPKVKKVGLPESETAESMDMLELLLGRLQELYGGKAFPRESDQKDFNMARKYVLVRETQYAQLIRHRNRAIRPQKGERNQQSVRCHETRR